MHPMRKARILIVDDAVVVRRLVTDILTPSQVWKSPARQPTDASPWPRFRRSIRTW